jgi:EmrB/QacA subfamily drug resistance transporter
MQPLPASEGSLAKRPGLVLATLCLANFMATLDLFVVNVALKDIGQDFQGQGLSNLSWILNGYAIVFGALLIPAGRLADKYGRRNAFVVGLALFTVASLACALAPGLWALVVFRCLQALGGAVLTPASLGLVLTALPADRVTNGVRLWAVSASLAGAAGPVVGGLLTDFSWRWIFVINIPLGLAAVAATVILIRNVVYDRSTHIPDMVGSAMLIVCVGAVSLGLVKGPDWGWADAKVDACWGVALAAAVGFVISTNRSKVPVVDFRMFRSRVFSTANIAAALLFGLTGMQLLSVSFFLQNSWHWSAVETGLGIAPGPAMVFLSSTLGQKLNARVPVGRVAAGGFLLVALGQALMILGVHDWHGYASAMLPGWLILGTGLGFALPTIVESATVDLAPEVSGTGSAINATARQIGAVLATAATVVILGQSAISGTVAKFYTTWWVVVIASAAGAIVVLGITPARRSRADMSSDSSTAGPVSVP